MINTNLLSAMSALGIGFTLIISVIAVVVFALLVWLIVKNIGEKSGSKFFKYAILAVLGAIVVRFIFALFVGGFRDDFLTYKNVIESASSGGLAEYFNESDQFTLQIFPVSYYLVLLFGNFGRALGFATTSAQLSIFIKIPFIVADALTVALLYKIASKYINEKVGLIIASAYAICPVFVLCAGAYGSTVSLVIPLLIWSGYSIVNKRHFQSMLAMGVAMITHQIAVYIFPVYAVYYVYRFVRSLIVTINAKKAGESGIKSKLCIKLPLYFLLATAIIYVICLPVSANSIGYNPFVLIYSLFIKPLADAYYFSNNGLSLYNIFGRNAQALGSGFPVVIFIVLFCLIIVGIVSVIYFSKRNTASVCLIVTYILYTVITYYIGINLTDIVPVCALLLLSYILTQDKRILVSFGLTTLATTMVMFVAMDNAVCLNMDALNTFYKTVFQITDGGGIVFLIIATLISVISHIYMSFTVLDITVTNKRKLLSQDKNAGIANTLIGLFK